MSEPVDPQRARIADRALEQLVGRLLQVGVLLSAAVTILGGALLLAKHGGEVPDYSRFNGEPANLTTLSGIIAGAFAMDSRSIIQLGLLLLIATPILRVAFTWVAFMFQRDRTYVALTTVVLALLVYGLVFGRA